MELTARKMRILQAIVDDYIASGIPVGSRTISKLWGGEISPATIRNEMSDLYEMGYLRQPHTSAGRIPSEKAYRFYVDRMLQVPPLSRGETARLKEYLTGRTDQVGEVIHSTARLLSEATQYASIGMAPTLEQVKIRQIRLVPVSENRALAVIVTDKGFVNDLFLKLPGGVEDRELDMISNALTVRMRGRSTMELPQVAEELVQELHANRRVFSSLIDALRESDRSPNTRGVVFDGGQNLFLYPEFNDQERVHSLMTALQTRDTVVDLLQRGGGELSVKITIGMESGIDDLYDTSVVTATYAIEGQPLGTFGVIGPMRMDYRRVIAVMRQINQVWNEILR